VLLHYLAKRGNATIVFSHSNVVSVHCQNSTSRSVVSSVFLTRDSYSRCLQSMRSARGCWRTWFRRKEVESAAAVGLCCTHNACAPMRCLPERKQEAQLPQRDRATSRTYRLRDIMAPQKWVPKTPIRVNRRGSKEVSLGRQGRVS